MGYYIRVLGKRGEVPSLEELRQAGSPGLIELEQGTEQSWESLALSDPSGKPIAVVERNPVVSGELGAKELQEFIDEVSHFKPESAAAWLESYLPKVEAIYAFQLLNGTDNEEGCEIMFRVYTAIWNHAGGILQADSEGFSNEDGFTILWQFADHVTGKWKVAVLDKDGSWSAFQIDLGNIIHREAFQKGEVPTGVAML